MENFENKKNLNGMEIERKFLVKEMPRNLENYKNINMVQGYLNTNPVVRVRKENDELFRYTSSAI